MLRSDRVTGLGALQAALEYNGHNIARRGTKMCSLYRAVGEDLPPVTVLLLAAHLTVHTSAAGDPDAIPLI
jgi:hypothetical protein